MAVYAGEKDCALDDAISRGWERTLSAGMSGNEGMWEPSHKKGGLGEEGVLSYSPPSAFADTSLSEGGSPPRQLTREASPLIDASYLAVWERTLSAGMSDRVDNR